MFQNRAEALALALPAAVFAAVIFLVPVVIVLAEGFRSPTGWTFSAYANFFSEPLNRLVLVRTFKLGLAVTLVSAVIGYAAAFAIVNLSASGKGRMIGLISLPLMISPVARTYAWIVILGRTGIVNQALQAVGLSDEPIRLLFTETAVFIGLLQLFLPLMILSLISALENMPKDAIPAARVLGANWDDSQYGVFTDRPGVLTNDFFVNLLDLGTTWKPLDPGAHAFAGAKDGSGASVGIGTRVDLLFSSNSELRAVAEVYASDDANEKFVRDFVAAWGKVTELDRFDLV